MTTKSKKPTNPFPKGSVSHIAWEILKTKKGARLRIPELTEAVSAKAGYEVSKGYVEQLRSRFRTGDRTHGEKLEGIVDLRFPGTKAA